MKRDLFILAALLVLSGGVAVFALMTGKDGWAAYGDALTDAGMRNPATALLIITLAIFAAALVILGTGRRER